MKIKASDVFFDKYPYYGGQVGQNLFEKELCLPSESNLSNDAEIVARKGVIDFIHKKNFKLI